MSFRKFILVSTMAFLPLMGHAEAKGFFHSSSHSFSHYSYSHVSHDSQSSSFSKPSSTSNSFSKPSPTNTFSKPTSSASATPSPMFSKPTATTATTQANGFSFSKPGATSSNQSASKSYSAPSSAVARAVTKSQSKSSLAAYTAEQQKYKAPPVGIYSSPSSARNSTVWRSYGGSYRTSDQYWAARNRAIAMQPPPPVYVVNGPPSYGGYAAAFLGGMLLDHITQPSYAEWAYSNQNDPDFQRWRSDMNADAADNADLRAKLAAMDQQVAQLQAQNAAKSTALPQGVDPAYAIAPSTALLATTHQGGIGVFGWIAIIFVVGVVVVAVLILMAKRRR